MSTGLYDDSAVSICLYITDINFLLAESVVIKVRIRGIANRY